ncbi:MAG TPA: glycosyltransferase family 4 protein [Acidobacteriota bacterium]|jgi:glycosyltransferase involved in cell wall biosynthesis|nr:glycosyltransferase family 4 protein [Acidobacteriota bacterium]
MRILMLADVFFPDTIGGAGRYVYDLARFLRAKGHQIHVVTRNPENSLPPAETIGGIAIYRFPHVRRRLYSYATARSLIAEILHDTGIDLLHGFQPLICSSAIPWLKRWPSVYTYFSPWATEYLIKVRRRTWFHRLVAWRLRASEGKVLRSAGTVVLLSQFAERLMREDHGEMPKTELIPGAVDLARFQRIGDPLKANLRRRWNIPETTPLLLTVRNLVPRMGLDYLLRALALLREQGVPFAQLIGGNGPLRSELENHARSLQLQKQVFFTGPIAEAEMPAYYSAADLFVLPTTELECFGLVVLESLACGTPVLSTRCGGPEEILDPLNPSWLCERYNPQALADGITRVLRQRPIHGDPLRRYVEENFSWNSIVVRMEALYAKVLGGC